jgi:hypothetical protein
MWLTLARDSATADETWIKESYDQAIAKASEDDRATADAQGLGAGQEELSVLALRFNARFRRAVAKSFNFHATFLACVYRKPYPS